MKRAACAMLFTRDVDRKSLDTRNAVGNPADARATGRATAARNADPL